MHLISLEIFLTTSAFVNCDDQARDFEVGKPPNEGEKQKLIDTVYRWSLGVAQHDFTFDTFPSHPLTAFD